MKIIKPSSRSKNSKASKQDEELSCLDDSMAAHRDSSSLFVTNSDPFELKSKPNLKPSSHKDARIKSMAKRSRERLIEKNAQVKWRWVLKIIVKNNSILTQAA